MGNQLIDLVTNSLQQGRIILSTRSETHRKQQGQFFTPAEVARFMAKQLGPIRSGDRILDPALGSGVLACAIIERLILADQSLEVWFDGYETDSELAHIASGVLKQAVEQAAERDIIVHTRVYEDDFILSATPALQPQLFLAESSDHSNANKFYTHIIANPPYFKLNRNDLRAKAVSGQVKGHTNIYTLFLALAAKKLTSGGRACFIVPRSFCSGAYFAAFRRDFLEEVLPVAVHLFESRQDTFKQDTILQENIIITFRRRKVRSKQIPPLSRLAISVSRDASDLQDLFPSRQIPMAKFIGGRHGTLFFRLPTNELDELILETMDRWTGSLSEHGLNVSTGPVVAFRAKSWLTNSETVVRNQAVPLLWMQNVKRQQVEWPLDNGNKPQGISIAEEVQSLLIPKANYVLLRRFSTKEEARRLVAAPFLANQFKYARIGLENHLNYIYRKQGSLDEVETIGLSALLNSALVDRYFRILNGNTQVNAVELRALPLPSWDVIRQIGRKILAINGNRATVDLEAIVFSVLQQTNCLLPEIPILRETRFTMGKIQEAQDILKVLGLPVNQQNEISALTLLVLAQLSEETPWLEAKQKSLRIHDILIEIKDRYGREYAENTRETIRRQVIHQFEQAGLVVRNPDDPTLATNSPRTHYALSDAATQAISVYRSKHWQQAIQSFIESRGTLLEIYQKSREQYKIPLRTSDGKEYRLSPGQHNELQFATFKTFLTDIAWETEVWLAEIPDHLIHFNGERFLGPP